VDRIEIVIRPKKRIFIALVSVATLAAAFVCYCIWLLMFPGLGQINHYLPYVIGAIILALILSLALGVLGIVLAILGVPTFKFFYFWAWHVVNFLFPLAVFLGGIFNVTREKIEQSFIEVSNYLVRQQKVKVPADRLLILTPHCIQLDTCTFKVTRDINNCHQCGRCGVGDLQALSKKYGLKVAISTGGTLARQAVKKARPKAIVAVACERDLTSGIQDVFPLPVLGVLNERPNGPCFNTRADMHKVEDAIKCFLIDEEIHEQTK
jgi:hypothetical protein